MYTTEEILQSLKDKFKSEIMVSQFITYPSFKKLKHSFGLYHPNLRVDIDNEIFEGDESPIAMYFQVKNEQQIIEVLDRHFNVRSSIKDFVHQFIKDNNIDLAQTTYLKFYLGVVF